MWDADTGDLVKEFDYSFWLGGEIATSADGSKVSIGIDYNQNIYDLNINTGELGDLLKKHYEWRGGEELNYFSLGMLAVLLIKQRHQSAHVKSKKFFSGTASAVSSPDNLSHITSHFDISFRLLELERGVTSTIFENGVYEDDFYSCYLETILANGFSIGMPPTFWGDHDMFSCHVSPDGRMLAIDTWAGEAYLRNLNDNSMVLLSNQDHLKRRADDPVYLSDIVFSPDCRFVAAGSFDQSVTVWNVNTYEKIHEFIITFYDGELAFSPDGKFLVATGKKLTIWDVYTDKVVFDDGEIDYPSRVAYSPSGDILAVGSYFGEVKLLDPYTGQIITTLDPSRHGSLQDLTFSSDGKMIASADTNGITHIWGIK